MLKVCNCCQRIYRNEEDFFNGTFQWRLDDKDNLWFTCSCNSSLVLPKGRYNWFSIEKTLSPKALEIFNTLLQGKSIARIPQSIARLRMVLDNPSNNVEVIVDAIKKEPTIMADVLKFANLLSSNNKQSITSITHAFMYIGKKSTIDLVNAAVIRAIEFNTEHFSYLDFWTESLLTGCIAEKLHIKYLSSFSADGVYLAGCLANLGKVIYASCLPNMADEVFKKANHEKTPWKNAEILLKMPDHSILGEIACVFWGMPRLVQHVNRVHHLESTVIARKGVEDSAETIAVDLIIIANQLMKHVIKKPYLVEEALLVNVCKRFDIDSGSFSSLAKEYEVLFEQVSKVFERDFSS